ncbi:MAG: LysR family transcriptional regulator [Rhodospirillaceae bacterium]|nr:LysR family transcriptional regulator [Rhodospirillaceae bacterium]
MKRGALPLNALRAFESAARLGRMGDAAAELGVTHGAISRQIRGLEALLGVRLFDGPRNRPVLTAAAERLLPRLTEAFDGLEDAVARLVGGERRTLDVSALGTFTMRWLIPRLHSFQQDHPDIEVRLTAEDAPVDFRRQRLDVAIRVGHGDWGAATVTPLFEDRVGPVLSPRLKAPERIVHWRDLADLPLLHTLTRPTAWPEWCRTVGAALPLEGRQFEHFYFMLEAATAGLGVAIAPDALVADDLAGGRLVAPFGFVASGRTYVALRRPGAGRDAAAFVAWLVGQAARENRTAAQPPLHTGG